MLVLKQKVKRLIELLKKSYKQKREDNLSRTLLSELAHAIESCDTIFIFLCRRKINFKNKLSFHAKIYSLIGFELAKRGFTSYYLFEDNVIDSYFPELVLNGSVMSNSLSEDLPRADYSSKIISPPSFEWDIGIEDEKAIIDDIDFFPLIRCTLRTIKKQYNIDLIDSELKELSNKMLLSCDLLLSYFFKLREYADKERKKIRICGWESNYIPNGLFNKLCTERADGADIQYIDLNRAYVHYFGEHSRGANYISTANLTKKRVVDRKAVTEEELNSVNISEKNMDQFSSSIEKALNKVFGEEMKDEKIETIKLMEEYRSRGKHVYVLYGHLFYDVGTDDSSLSFPDMCEWLKETILFFKGRDDLLLLKPHPVETQKKTDETLFSFAKSLVSTDNIRILNPLLFNVRELSSYMSCGLVWRSSVGLELTYLKVPCIIAGRPRYNVLNLNYPRDKKDYFSMIRNSDQITTTDEQIRDVIRYVYYLENKKSFRINPVESNGTWNKVQLLRYIKSGDTELERLVDEILQESC